ncbi:uncharacterized protein, partial [Diadema setosum]|uniref:uncharacterized protein n=1 Tax=Diadema setosum TaxID=31175 RepID=UPI003B3A1926
IQAHPPAILIFLSFYISLTSAESVCFQRDVTCNCMRPPPTVPNPLGCIQTTITPSTVTPDITDESTTIDTTSQSTTDPVSTVQTTEGQTSNRGTTQARTNEPQLATTVSLSTTDATSNRQTTEAETTLTKVTLGAEATSKATTEASTEPITKTSTQPTTQASTQALTEATSEEATNTMTKVTGEATTAETTKLTTKATTEATSTETTMTTTKVTEATTVETTEPTTETTTKATTEATTKVTETTTAETTELTTETSTETTTDKTTVETTKATTEVTEATTAKTTKGITTDLTPTIESTVPGGVIQNPSTSEFSMTVESRNNVQRKRRRRDTLPNDHPNVVELQTEIESAVTNLTEVAAANSTVQSAETSDDDSLIRTTLRLTVQHNASVISTDLTTRLNTAIASIDGVRSVNITDVTGLPACSKDTCKNGDCVADNSGFLICRCQSGYSGQMCSSADPTDITILLLAVLLPLLALLVFGVTLALTVLVIRKTRRKMIKLQWFPAERTVTKGRGPRDRADGIPGGMGKPGGFNPYTSTHLLAAYGIYTKRYSSRPEKFANKSSKGSKLNGQQSRNLYDVYHSNGLSPIPKPLQGNRQNGDIRRDSSTVHYRKEPSQIPQPLRGNEANGDISPNPNTVYYGKGPSSSPQALKGNKPNGDLSRNPYTAHYSKGPSSFPQDIRGNKASSDISRNPYTVYHSNKLPLLPRAVTGKKSNGDSRQDPLGVNSRNGLPSYAHPLQLTGLNLAVSPRQAYALEAISRPRARQAGVNRSGYHYDQPYGRKASLVDGSSERQDFLVSSEYF